MNRDTLIKYIHTNYGVSPEYMWDKHPNYIVFRHQGNSKWFAIIMDIPINKLTDSVKSDDVVDLKVAPEIVGSLRLQKGVYPAYHMNKEHWISIQLGSNVDEVELQSILDDSYKLTL